MENYTASGRLIGYRNYVNKENKTVHIYSVLTGDRDAKGFYEDVALVSIFSDTQVLPKLCEQAVEFDMTLANFGGKLTQKYKNIRAVKPAEAPMK